MARTLNNLSDVKLKAKGLKPGRHSDGGGLYLNVSPSGSKSWLFMWTVEKKRREMGLGSYPDVSLADAREKARAFRSQVESGLDPIKERNASRASTIPTFGGFADDLLSDIEGGFRNEKHRNQWRSTLGDAYCAKMRKKKVSDIDTADVLAVLKPIWQEKNETASRIRGRIERVLDAAKAKGLRQTENPARWRGHLDALLPKRTKLQRGHHAALGWKEMPDFWKVLAKLDSVSSNCLAFTILTAARSGEARGATWQEIDSDNAVWNVPAPRMKAGKPHSVPLTGAAVAILNKMKEGRKSGKPDELVFPSIRDRKPLTDTALLECLKGIRTGITVHGFRSTFRDWAGDSTSFPRELAEQALAHTIGGVEGAYRRGDALERRREMMEAWERYLRKDASENVIALKKAVGK